MEIKSNSEEGSPWFFICLCNVILLSKMEQLLKGCYRNKCHRYCHRGTWARESARRHLSGIKSKIYSLSRIGIVSQLLFLFFHWKTGTRTFSVQSPFTTIGVRSSATTSTRDLGNSGPDPSHLVLPSSGWQISFLMHCFSLADSLLLAGGYSWICYPEAPSSLFFSL